MRMQIQVQIDRNLSLKIERCHGINEKNMFITVSNRDLLCPSKFENGGNPCSTVFSLVNHKLFSISAMQVGPSLGMRKSSSLESLQTAVKEIQRNAYNEPIYARAHPRK